MKSLFVTQKGNEGYDLAKHSFRVHNFLYWHSEDAHSGLLLTGDGDYGLNDGSHRNLLICAKKNGCEIPDRYMDGAGNFAGNEMEVWSWKSSGFNVITPENLHPIILNILCGTKE